MEWLLVWKWNPEEENSPVMLALNPKITRKPLPTDSRTRATKSGERIYSDVWGPARHVTLHKQFYYVSFTNDYERELVLYLMRTKDETFSKYKLYEAMLLRQGNKHIG